MNTSTAGDGETPGGPLTGIHVVEVQGLGPAPFCGMVLADLGADVIRVERVPGPADAVPDPAARDLLGRGKRSIAVDLKHPDGYAVVRALVGRADVILEGSRPGVMERLGLGPEVCLADNPRLIFGRMTGWGQDGPLSARAGHDINYLSIGGVLDAIGRRDQPPTVPLSLVGDFGGGGLLLALGVCAALLERVRSGAGQVVDAAIVDGASVLMTLVHLLRGAEAWNDERGTNLFDSGSPFYDVYETADHRYMSVGAIEPRFYAQFIDRLGPAAEGLPAQYNRSRWPQTKARLERIFRQRTQAEWCAVFADADACVTPVLSGTQAFEHPHNVARGSFVRIAGVTQPAPAPRFQRTPSAVPAPPPVTGADTNAVLTELGRSDRDTARLRRAGAIG